MTWEEDHCPVTELLRETCAHCRPRAERARLERVEHELSQHGASPRSREIAPDRGFEDGPTISAAYAGRCPECRHPITPGEHIRLHGGRYCHAECLD